MVLQLLISACEPSPSASVVDPAGVVTQAVDTNVALGKSITTSGYTQVYAATNANDNNRATYWEGTANAYPNTLTVNLGSNHTISSVVVQLNPDSAWSTRTQTFSVLGHNASTTTFSTLVASATYTFNPSTGNQVTIPVSGTVSEVRLQFTANSGAPGGQVAEFQILGSPAGGTTYALTVNNGSGSGSYASGAVVNISANAPSSGQVFNGWTGGVASSFGNASSASTTYTMTAAATTITATYTASTGGSKYEGESATLSGGAQINSNHTGYSGTGFVEGYWTQGARTQFNVSVASAGWYDVTLRYGNGFTDSNLSLYVGGTKQGQVSLPTTGAWTTWANKAQAVYLNAGSNAVAYQYDAGDVANVNLDYITVAATATQRADLTVTDIQWTAPSSPPQEGEAISFKAVVKNAGTGASPSSVHKVSFLVNGAEVAVSTLPSTTSLAAGASVTLTANASWSTSYGSYPVTAVVDPDNAIAEFNDSNNSFTKTLTVSRRPGPDLIVQAISSTPSTPAAGAAVSFTVTVTNQGLDPTPGSSVAVRLVIDGATTLNGTVPSSLAAGAGAAVTLSGTWTATNGNHTLVATVDPASAISESVETNNSLTSSLFVGRGANVPWIEYEAENGRTNGAVQGPSRALGTIAGEASGRKAVVLNATGQYVEWTTVAPANAIVVRNSMPDAAGGGGIQATLSLYVNGSKLGTLNLSSKEAWVYGDDATQFNSPSAGAPRRIYDESSKLLNTTIPAGATVRLQKDSGDTSPYYAIDFIDLELVGAPIAKPAGYIDVTEGGHSWAPAIPNDGISDENAINQAIWAVQAGTYAGVYLPPGTFDQTNKIQVKGVTIQGAGMWYTKLYNAALNEDAGWGQTGFIITGDNAKFRDFAIFGNTDGLRTQGGKAWVNSAYKNTVIENMWVEHVQCAYWVGGNSESTNLRISNSRFRNTGADAVNLCNGTKDSIVENSHARNTGDDAFAIWSATDLYPFPATNNVIRNCTVQIVWRAAGFAIYGGLNNRIENSVVSDTLTYPGLTVSSEFNPYPMQSATVDGLTIIRSGGTYWGGQQFGSIWLRADQNPTNNITIKNVDIIDPTYQGISIQSNGGVFTNLAFQNITINNPTNYGIQVLSTARGGGTFTNVTVNNAPTAKVANQSSGGFTITSGGGNNW
ncbi:APHP domain protein [Hyalangium minutum]|uniref:APHP domain protein n=1 Tax=Hyalangium minutum TaxID=394096 RepID=A0A085WRI4_9BACT|nr:APHP domain protein [Hyalangium minutum]